MDLLATPRLLLRPVTAELAALAADGRVDALGRTLDAHVAVDWPPRIDDDDRMARDGFTFAKDILQRNPSLVGWWGWWVILQQPRPTLIGVVSPKGPPDREGTVEVAYGIVGSMEGKGYATEATCALMDWVRKDPSVRKIVAETLPQLAASIGVMEKCGMAFLGEGSEPGTVRYGLVIAR
jgi:RimJ/RimL family protein N-acetyltransferase